MPELRLNHLIVGVVAVLGIAVVWDVVNNSRQATVAPPDTAAVVSDSAALIATPPTPDTRTQAGRVEPVSSANNAPGYMEQLARADARRQIRGSIRNTYLNEILAKSTDSVLHRWDNRITNPVRVYLRAATVANYQPAFLDAVRTAFQRWEGASIPVRFDLSADSVNAEVTVQWRVQFEIERTGQTDLTWDAQGHHQSGVITLATFNQLGQPMGADEIRIVAVHEIGHLLGLDHSSDSTDLMFPVARVRDLSTRDIQSALLLYQLTPGSIR